MKDLIKDYLSIKCVYKDVDIINIDPDRHFAYVTFEYTSNSGFRHSNSMYINIWSVLVFVNDKLD